MYYPRLIQKEIELKLKTSGAVLVYGPKFCGKTTTCMLYQKSYIKLNTKQRITMARLNPMVALEGEEPHLIDEWQTAPDIWNQIKETLDEDYRFGRFLLTGSSTPVDKADIYHTGAGRITPVFMRTMSLWESQESEGKVSLSSLFEGNRDFNWALNSKSSLEEIAFLICRGGWPISVTAHRDIALEITKNYYNSLFVFEESENELFRNKKTEVIKMILKSYARNISSEASISTIISDVRQSNERPMDVKTFNDYLEAIKDIFIIEDLQAWNPSIRSKTSIRSTPTRHFVDTSIACRALNISPKDLLNDLETFGLFFEDFAVRDLRIYANYLGGEVRHYRDNTGLECDAIIILEDGSWGAVEIKLGGEKLIEDGASTLIRLQNKIVEKSSEKKPSFLMVLTAISETYIREDGVIVAPVTSLKP